MAKVKSEVEWMAEGDAQTLVMAETIMQDPARLRRAKPKVAKIAREKAKEAKEAQAAAGVIKKKSSGNPTKRATKRRGR